ncbi:hypothetical protein FRB98_003504 [Tulasnella sp. 332]|nr:hypothetical protein FRB98_003504 [Tulasnella sp. 332]
MIRTLSAKITVIEGDDCTKDVVMNGLKEASCITLLDNITTGLPKAELSVLSACHSAAGDESTPDEEIHLIAGMLFISFKSVVGTMWAIADKDGPVIAEEFYKYIFRNRPEATYCKNAADGSAKAIRAPRRRQVSLERWINFVHYGV